MRGQRFLFKPWFDNKQNHMNKKFNVKRFTGRLRLPSKTCRTLTA